MFGILKQCPLLYYSIVFLLLIVLQTILIYYHIPGKDHKHPKIIHKNHCVNKTISRNLKIKITNKCIFKGNQKYAFVFYITNSMKSYECYIYVLLHQLQVKYPQPCNVDYVILYETGYKFQKQISKFKNIKLKEVKKKELHQSSSEEYYNNCYIKLEAFSLYTSYTRIVFLDADGLLTKDPYPLFNTELFPHQVGASYCNWYFPEKWLTSSIFVSDLNRNLYHKIQLMYTTNLKTLYPHRKKILDMEIFNWILQNGNKTKIIPDLINLDSHYIDKDYVKRFYNASHVPYYVHFSHIKPHLNRRMSACYDERTIAKPEFYKIHKEFWTHYYIYC